MTDKRSWKSIALELLAWFLFSVVTAVILVMMSESLLPANF